MKIRLFKAFIFMTAMLICGLGLTGCLSHYFVETTTRLQIENATEDCTLMGVDISSEEDGKPLKWISETVLPGERSHVVEMDLVGEFTISVKYTRSTDGSGEILLENRKMEIEGGSIYMKVESDGDSLSFKIR